MIGLDKEYNLKFEYLGQVKNKKRDGRGKCFWEYNLMYEGYFKKATCKVLEDFLIQGAPVRN